MIEAENLTRHFGERLAVDRISLRVPDGTVLALLGPNGAGKTTTVRMLAGLLAPSEGRASIGGCDVRSDPATVRARVGLVTDVPGLYEQMTLPAYLDFFGRIYGLSSATRSHRIDELIALFELQPYRKERMAGFSKGMKQKVAIARALLHEPEALFLDEPTSGLDPLAARTVRELIVGLTHASRSIILCTHDLDEAERLADQVAILRGGRIAACGTPAALRAQASPDTTVHIVLAIPCPAALTALHGIEGALAPELNAGSLRLAYRTRSPATVNPLVLSQLIAEGAAIISVTLTTRSLEEVYADTVTAQPESVAPDIAVTKVGGK